MIILSTSSWPLQNNLNRKSFGSIEAVDNYLKTFFEKNPPICKNRE